MKTSNHFWDIGKVFRYVNSSISQWTHQLVLLSHIKDLDTVTAFLKAHIVWDSGEFNVLYLHS